METMLLLVLLMMSSDERSGETLRKVLRLYRENRELLSSLAGMQGGDAQKTADIAQNSSEPQKESRPREEVGNADVLEEYLRRFSV